MTLIDVSNTQPTASISTQLPVPVGYKILCALPNVDDKYENGLIKADETKRIEEQTTVILFVVAMGDMCYLDKTKFPTNPWCKVGDFILTRPYTGTRVIIHGKEFRIINDDAVEAVVDDPRGYRRV
jgi:co-chaperonin GroES (HSP10)